MLGQQIFAFIFAEDTQSQADNGPQMNHTIAAAVVLAELMNLGMTVMTAGDAIIGAGSLNLNVLQPAEFQALLFVSRLQKTAATAATIIVGAVGLHIDKIFLSYDGFHHKTQIFGDRVAIAFTYNLAGILDRKLDF